MKRICAICGERMKAGQSDIRHPIGKTKEGKIIMDIAHFNCWFKKNEKNRTKK